MLAEEAPMSVVTVVVATCSEEGKMKPHKCIDKENALITTDTAVCRYIMSAER